jgi:hypothetical protein
MDYFLFFLQRAIKLLAHKNWVLNASWIEFIPTYNMLGEITAFANEKS